MIVVHRLAALLLFFFLLLAGDLPGSQAWAESLPIAPFEARYTVYAKGIPAGESILTLTEIGAGRYQMHSEVFPTGLATLLVSERLSESVDGEWRDDAILPTHYEQERVSSRKPTKIRFDFDWPNGTVHTRYNGQQATLALGDRIVDPLSLHLLVMWDLQRGHHPERYTLVKDTEMETYRVRLEGEDTLQTPLGKLKAVRISRQKPGSNRITTLWLAPRLNYLLVQVTQTKKGSEDLKMVIASVKGSAYP
ncbi:MAG: DUF3108 domain-containing protein [Gammaproteobacteria bacterium]|nr:DUF3108 domain-containing protein [Gammaproteobacteria bacterium]MCP5424288.1 DUF3108 domain-containing protein [Gammaproteobacteria bacterium]MCP5459041.1 DUF3108 domain-containing protein [Gammaproteobacteria bacterium]